MCVIGNTWITFKIEQQYRYYSVDGRKMEKMYFVNHMPFTFDQLTELEVNDPLVIEEIPENVKTYQRNGCISALIILLQKSAIPVSLM